MCDRRSALTLVEVALVTSVLSLLAAVLLPALGTAREQARVRQCVANLGRIGAGANAYLAEFSSLPFALQTPYRWRGVQYSFSYFSEFGTLGGMPDKTLNQWNGAADLTRDLAGRIVSAGTVTNMDAYSLPPAGRPLNPYLEHSVGWSRPRSVRTTVPMSLPGTFRCPDDSSAGLPSLGGNAGAGYGYRSWEWWGSSYFVSWWWVPYYGRDLSDFGEIVGFDPTVPSRGSQFVADASGPQAAELVVYMESFFSYVLHGSRPQGYTAGPWAIPAQRRTGWHNQFNKHVAAFRDGSARYQIYDTQYNNGDGWTMWPKRPWLPPWDQYDGVGP